MNKESPFYIPQGSMPKEIIEAIEYRSSRKPEVPKVNRYDLSVQEAWAPLGEALRRVRQWEATTTRGIIAEAVRTGVIVDTFTSHLYDMYKIEKSPLSFEEYKRRNYNVENVEISERPWIKEEGRFAIHAHKEPFKKVKSDRGIFIREEGEDQKLEEFEFAAEGAGVAAAAAYLAAAEGVGHVRIADPGVLHMHRFNRFPFADLKDVGTNLAVIVGRRILELDPFVDVKVVPFALGADGQKGTYPLRRFLTDPRRASKALDGMDKLEMKKYSREISEELGIAHGMISDLDDDGGLVGFNDNVLTRIRENSEPDLESTTGPLTNDQFMNLVIKHYIGPTATRRQIAPLLAARDSRRGILPQSGTSAWIMGAVEVLTIKDMVNGKAIPSERSIRVRSMH